VLVDLEVIAVEDTAESTAEGTAESIAERTVDGIVGDTAEDIAADIAAAAQVAAHIAVRRIVAVTAYWKRIRNVWIRKIQVQFPWIRLAVKQQLARLLVYPFWQ
jgi:hypothetical protein